MPTVVDAPSIEWTSVQGWLYTITFYIIHPDGSSAFTKLCIGRRSDRSIVSQLSTHHLRSIHRRVVTCVVLSSPFFLPSLSFFHRDPPIPPSLSPHSLPHSLPTLILSLTLLHSLPLFPALTHTLPLSLTLSLTLSTLIPPSLPHILTIASLMSQRSSHTVPHTPEYCTSTRPLLAVTPPTRRRGVVGCTKSD